MLKAKGVALRCTEQPVDMTTASGKCFLDMLSVFAEFECSLRRERQSEGIAKAKAKGVYRGRPKTINPALIQEKINQGNRIVDVVKAMGISHSSVERAIRSLKSFVKFSVRSSLL